MAYIPLTNNPEETFNVVISGVVYNMRQLWNTKGYWTLDILSADNSALVYGIKLVTKTDLTTQYPNIPFDLFSDSDEDPSRSNLDSFNLAVTDKDV